MKGGPNGENRITKARRFFWRIIKKLGSNKEIYGNSKRSYKETIW